MKRQCGHRKKGGVVYTGYCRPKDIMLEYQYAIFGIFPIGQIEVVADPEDGAHEKKLERAAKGLPCGGCLRRQ